MSFTAVSLHTRKIFKYLCVPFAISQFRGSVVRHLTLLLGPISTRTVSRTLLKAREKCWETGAR